ncbi:DUF4157 domain-containing protein [Pseudoxanthomonas sangjuensis]|uniref:eCIS core domain-containing protein n=1 Tax=Pseudoxanthomonas sangjuensis TaxID=1503750 RepID=UPI001B879023|nr:DUF4157 domain-containing protein [Pseudoxanthomonas sangjuensis]
MNRDNDLPPPQSASRQRMRAPDVRRALDAPAVALPPALNGELARHYGRDFGDVRIHADAEAGASALALGAEAYTVGRDIVFAPGAYRPGSIEGRRLVAHEAAHVLQQDGRVAAGGALRVDAHDSAAEHEAERAATGFGRPESAATQAPRPRHGPPTLQRSLFGSIVGGLLGGGAGAGIGIAIGSLLGPVGMVVGGIVGGLAGLVGGAIVGDLASRRSRGLSSAEKTYLREIFRDSVDYDAVTITRGSALSAGAARTTGNTINLQDEHFVGDTLDLSDAGTLVLAHEMGHVWQYQNGGLAYIPSSLIPQIKAAVTGGDRNAAYNWRDAVRNHIDWADWNAEQQAECISDYNEALRRLNADAYSADAEGGQQRLRDIETVVLAEPYIELVRARVGAPGSSRRRREPSATPADAGGAPGAGRRSASSAARRPMPRGARRHTAPCPAPSRRNPHGCKSAQPMVPASGKRSGLPMRWPTDARRACRHGRTEIPRPPPPFPFTTMQPQAWTRRWPAAGSRWSVPVAS